MSPKKASLLRKLDSVYSQLGSLKRQTEAALNSYTHFPELCDTVNELRKIDYRFKELLIAQAQKAVPINIGDETASIMDTLDVNDSSTGQARRAQAKKLARRLYSLYHTDREGGNQALFDLVRKAANAGDLETLMFYRVREGIDTYEEKDMEELIQKIDVQSQMFRGKPSFQIARAYYSSEDKKEYVAIYLKHLKAKIHELNMQMFGLTSKREENDRSQEG